jgi:hypothetical protein
VVLLSEVHPLAYLRVAQAYPYYFPTDLIQQLSLPHNGRDPALCVAAWNGAIDGLHSQLQAEGRILVLRSHSHVDFFSGVVPSTAPLVSRCLAPRHTLQQLLSVRHPLDSWLSLCDQGWHHQFRFPTHQVRSREIETHIHQDPPRRLGSGRRAGSGRWFRQSPHLSSRPACTRSLSSHFAGWLRRHRLLKGAHLPHRRPR